MRKEYDLENINGRKNPYAAHLKKQMIVHTDKHTDKKVHTDKKSQSEYKKD